MPYITLTFEGTAEKWDVETTFTLPTLWTTVQSSPVTWCPTYHVMSAILSCSWHLQKHQLLRLTHISDPNFLYNVLDNACATELCRNMADTTHVRYCKLLYNTIFSSVDATHKTTTVPGCKRRPAVCGLRPGGPTCNGWTPWYNI